MIIKCDKCGKIFKPGNRVDGIPNGIGLVDDNGRTINICSNCVIILGLMSDAGKRKFFESLGAEFKNGK